MTSRNQRSIKEAIASAYGELLKYEVRGQSLKISCVNTEQKAAMLQCTDIGDTAVEASIPRPEGRRNKLAENPILKYVAMTGVPLDIDDEEIQCATGADSVRRITKRDI